MHYSCKYLEVVSWLLVLIAPIIFQWVPSYFGFHEPPGDSLDVIIYFTVWPALPFLVFAYFVHRKIKKSQQAIKRDLKKVIIGIIFSMFILFSSVSLLYFIYWHQDVSVGVNLGLGMLIEISPILSIPIIWISYTIGSFSEANQEQALTSDSEDK